MACHRWKRRHFVLTDDLLEYWDRMQGNAPFFPCDEFSGDK
jgi:hypothetical protein